jgi:hypothetical protein
MAILGKDIVFQVVTGTPWAFQAENPEQGILF